MAKSIVEEFPFLKDEEGLGYVRYKSLVLFPLAFFARVFKTLSYCSDFNLILYVVHISRLYRRLGIHRAKVSTLLQDGWKNEYEMSGERVTKPVQLKKAQLVQLL
jgi:hypothetical protein